MHGRGLAGHSRLPRDNLTPLPLYYAYTAITDAFSAGDRDYSRPASRVSPQLTRGPVDDRKALLDPASSYPEYSHTIDDVDAGDRAAPRHSRGFCDDADSR